MRLKVKNVNISTGDTLVVIMNRLDAMENGIHPEDRINLSLGKRSVIAIVDITESDNQVKQGQIGLMHEVVDELCARDGAIADIRIVKNPSSIQHIKDKLNGKELSFEDMDEIIGDIVNNRLTQVEMTYFVAACYKSGLSKKETVSLTKAIVKNGDVFKPNSKLVVDKHCIGGVPGNRTTMVVVPILAAGGLTIPKTSSRSITSPSGTADTMEVLANVCIPLEKLKKVMAKTNSCIIWGGAFGLAAADDKLIRLRHPLSLDPVGMVLASVLAKKRAVSATHVLIDIPIGRGAKIQDRKEALRFKSLFEHVGSEIGMKVKVVITDGSQPIGNGIGPSLEARDVLFVLKNDNRAPRDLLEKSLDMAGEIFEMAGRSKRGAGRKLAEEILYSGKAYKKMVDIINAQGPRITEPGKIKLGRFSYEMRAGKAGKIVHIDNKSISTIAWSAGAPIDKGAGMYIRMHRGEPVKKGDVLYTLYADSREKMGFARVLAEKSNGYEIM
jgi:putative thymidine phosphorylase